MRVAVVVGRFPVPSQTFILNQLVALIERGIEVEIFAQSRAVASVHHQSVLQHSLLTRTLFRQMPRRRTVRAIQALKRLSYSPPDLRRPLLRSLNFRRWGSNAVSFGAFFDVLAFGGRSFDVIHCHFASNGECAIRARELGALSGAVITTFHGFDVNRRACEDAYGLLFQKGDFFTANTRFTADRAAELGCPRDRIAILPMGLRVEEYRFRERSRLPGERLRVLSVARLVEKKGLKYGIEAVAELARGGVDVEYTIVGDGPLRDSLRRLAAEHKIAERVHFLGWRTQDEVAALYDGVHLFVLPSVTAADGDREGQGLVLQEAQASGLPVISTLHNGIPDGVLDGVSGVLIPEADSGALARALQSLADQPERWPAMGRAGRQFVEQRYDADLLTNQLLAIYERAVDLR